MKAEKQEVAPFCVWPVADKVRYNVFAVPGTETVLR
jgi:hypothetical protein